jgi:hydrogenase maturation protein HypF
MYLPCHEFILTDSSGNKLSCNEPVKQMIHLLEQGKIIALKGVGGFHLCCNAENEYAVDLLRKRKKRPYKPFAIMAKDLNSVEKICIPTLKEKEILSSKNRPIVLITKNPSCLLPDNIAPFQKNMGIMLPYTSLHHLIFEDKLEFLIMTSANISNNPTQYENETAFKELKELPDFFLVHNKKIHIPIDDSVVRVINKKEMVSRCGRGYSPFSFPINVQEEFLAVGAEQKSTFCLTKNSCSYLSQYLGDLKSLYSYQNYENAIKLLSHNYNVHPKIIAHDLHPAYLSTRFAHKKNGIKIPIQHHHAHMASCMAEHHLKGPVIGVIYDGTGLGTDEAIWGGEFFIGTKSKVNRVGHLKYVLLQGGDLVIKEPWRTALCYLYAFGIDAGDLFPEISSDHIHLVQKALKSNFCCHLSSSMGRFFDCIAAILKIRTHITYDAQGAIELESLIEPFIKDSYPFTFKESKNCFQIDYKEILNGLLEDLKNMLPLSYISAKFHNSICNLTVASICKLEKIYGLKDVVLSGGVFENRYLLENIYYQLKHKGFNVFFNKQIPINDSGISFGQMAIVEQLLQEGKINVPSSSR